MVKSVKLWLLAAILALGALDIRASDDSMDFLKGTKAASGSSAVATTEVPVQALATTSGPVTTSTLPAAASGAGEAVTTFVEAIADKPSIPTTTGAKLDLLVGGVDRIEEAVGGIAQAVGAPKLNVPVANPDTTAKAAAKPNVPVANPDTTAEAVDKTSSFLAQHPNLKKSLIVGGVVVGAVVTGWAVIKIYHMSRAWLYDIERRLELVSGTHEDDKAVRKAYFKLHKMYATNSNWGGISTAFQHVLNSPAQILATDNVALRLRLTQDLMNERIFVADIGTNQGAGDYCDVQNLGKRLNEQGLQKIKAAIRVEKDEFLRDMQKLQKYFTLTVPALAPADVPVGPVVPVVHYRGTNWMWNLAGSAKAGLSAVVTSLLSRKVDDTRAISASYEATLVEKGLQIAGRQPAAHLADGAGAGDGGGAPVEPAAPATLLVSLTHLQQDQIDLLRTAFLRLVVGGGDNNEYAKLYFRAAMAYVRLVALDQKIDVILQEVALEAMPAV